MTGKHILLLVVAVAAALIVPGAAMTQGSPALPDASAVLLAAGSHAGRFATYEGTRTCLTCHTDKALEVHASVHYQWKGSAPDVAGAPASGLGKLGGINDFCIYPDINWLGKLTNLVGNKVDGGCAVCHAGLGDRPAKTATTAQLENIDCLVCHSDAYKRTVKEVSPGVFRQVPDTAAMTVPLLEAAQNVGRPSTAACLRCHAKSGGGNNWKRGDIELTHLNATRDFDVHMAPKSAGGAGLSCLDCHTAKNHRIAGRGSDERPRDSLDKVDCTRCHTATPHGDLSGLKPTMDLHAKRINCTVCHIPAFARGAETDMVRDWTKPFAVEPDKMLYDPWRYMLGNVIPQYRFWNGRSTFYYFGTEAQANTFGRVSMSAPSGNVADPASKLNAFKRHVSIQPMDPVTRRLLPIKNGYFFQTGDLDGAVRQGVAAVGWPDNGHTFQTTERWMGLFHEVAPAGNALSCTECHSGGKRIQWDVVGYKPKAAGANGKPLCASCHEDKSREWTGNALFTNVHKKHVEGERIDCSSCHGFKAAL